jgi:glycosyltransferase involved in cell wall biosynthesis
METRNAVAEPFGGNEERPTLSVIVPTYNRLPRLRRVLEGLGHQTASSSSFEVIVVSDGSVDGTDDYLRSHRPPVPVVVVSQTNQGPAAARNAGIAAARGELALFIDDDVVPGPTLIQVHLDSHRREGPDVVVMGPMLSPPDARLSPWVAWEQAGLYKQYAAMVAGEWEPTARQFFTGNASLRRSHLCRAGGFDPRFTRAEDVELAYRLAGQGLRFVFNPDAEAYHYAERSYGSWLDIAYSYGLNDVAFATEGNQTWLLPTVRREFEEQHRLVQALVRSCLSRRALATTAVMTLGAVGVLAGGRRSTTASRAALSGAYALRYYQGVDDALGGGRRFFDLDPNSSGTTGSASPAPEPDLAEAPTPPERRPAGSVVIPAHNEGRVIERCLQSLATGAADGEFEVVVVANGCTDDTAERARQALPSAVVVELEQASKSAALNAGDAAARAFPRAYLDADVVVDLPTLRRVFTALDEGPALCAAPRMAVHLEDRPWYVRSFYRAFLQLPYMRDNMVGNGFYALSVEGRKRFDRFPDITADDLFVRNQFATDERVVLEDRSFLMFPPRRLAGLLAIRQRTYRGNREYDEAGLPWVAEPTLSRRAHLDLARRRPFDVAVFWAVNLAAKATNARRRSTTWERDDSARSG